MKEKKEGKKMEYHKTLLEKSLEKEYNQEIKIGTADDIYREMTDLKDEKKEVFVVFHLNTKNKIILREIVSIGILNASLIHPRETFRTAIINNANSIILAHNHPSGDATPSQGDKDITKTLVNAGEILGIKVLDHIITGKNSFVSMNQRGDM